MYRFCKFYTYFKEIDIKFYFIVAIFYPPIQIKNPNHFIYPDANYVQV